MVVGKPVERISKFGGEKIENVERWITQFEWDAQ
jgi:hypothetical protein